MKFIFQLLIACAPISIIQAQFTQTIPVNNIDIVSIAFQYGNVQIEKHDKKEIEIEGTFIINGIDVMDKIEIKNKTKGSELVLSLETEIIDTYQSITTTSRKDKKNESENFKCPVLNKEVTTYVEAEFIIKVPSNLQLHINSTYGSASVNGYWEAMDIFSTYGSVDVILNNVPAKPQIKMKSTYSSVDLTIPTSVDARVSMKTSYGKVFTDLDLKPEYKKERLMYGEDITASINGGNGEISLIATYSNIYLRRAEAQ